MNAAKHKLMIWRARFIIGLLQRRAAFSGNEEVFAVFLTVALRNVLVQTIRRIPESRLVAIF